LIEAAHRIAVCVNESDTVARISGDDFRVMLPYVADYNEAERMARTITAKLSEPYLLDDREVFVTASAGVALYPQDGREAGDILQKADSAKAQAKLAGDSVVLYEPEMNARAERRLDVETDLRRTLGGKQLEMYYQPIVDHRRHKIVSAEALIRWNHPEWGIVTPFEFIPVAEESGLIVEIGMWIVDDVATQLERWQAEGIKDLGVSINLSARQLKLSEDREALLSCLDRPIAKDLTLEITETLLMEDLEAVKSFLESAKSHGVKIALDDFGTGFSSLSYLRKFPFDVLKIDKAFIDDLERSHADLALVASIVSMGRILGMQVVAEGVETESQVTHLGHIGCSLIQGYHYAKPMPADDFLKFYRDWNT
jgi:predicted signal transduction protein with EAL and GGDEF domain